MRLFNDEFGWFILCIAILAGLFAYQSHADPIPKDLMVCNARLNTCKVDKTKLMLRILDRLDQLDRLETKISKIEMSQRIQLFDRSQAIKSSQCSDRCQLIPADNSDDISWENTERGKCYAKCRVTDPYPAAFGGGGC